MDQVLDRAVPQQLYTPEDHATWRALYGRMLPLWRQFANARFLQGVDALSLPADRVPYLEDVNRFLQPLTGFRATPVGGYLPAYEFFDCLRRREFPTTVTVRAAESLDYLPEPDIFHDIAGHVPMHTDRAFADTLVRFGECAQKAARGSRDPEKLASRIRAMARFFWFTVEFGLMRAQDGVKAYGSGLLSSFGELQRSILSPSVQRYPAQIEWIVNQGFEIDHYQPLLFIVDSFDHLFELTGTLEHMLRNGSLDNVAPGQPQISVADLESFRAGHLS
ncbi:MAG TPA: phenylalanine 4-monooxygenase [Bryobacteraceae bacterium]|nr:phenylalanine 4-monooxygenase [Bryobacteraceae bacterium]